MVEEYPKIIRGSAKSLPTTPSIAELLSDMYGALKQEPPEVHPGKAAHLARVKAALEVRINQNAEAIIQMKEEGLSNLEISKKLGVSNGTVHTWWNRIKKERGL